MAAETRQAREAAGWAQQMLDLARRQARQIATTAWDARAAAEERVTQRKISVAANEVADARTLIEVLNAQQERFAAGVALVSARHDAILETLRVLQATGGLTAEALALPAPSYDPVRHYDEVRNKWGGLSVPP